MDVVYVYKSDANDNSTELRYSLRSLANLSHNNVFIVGESPDWLDNVILIPVEQTPVDNNPEIKQRNVAKSLMTVCNDTRVSDNFVLMNDDFYIIDDHPTGIPVKRWGLTADIIAMHKRRFGGNSPYYNAMVRVHDMLLHHGIQKPINYELHVPYIVNKQRYIKLRKEFNDVLASTPTCLSQWRTIYGNYFNIGGEYMDDVKIYKNDNMSYNDLQKFAFLSGTTKSFNNTNLGVFIKSRFARKSRYEL